MPATIRSASAPAARSARRRHGANRPPPAAIHPAATRAATATPVPVVLAAWKANGPARRANVSTGRAPAWQPPARCRLPPRRRISSAPAPSDARDPTPELCLALPWNLRPATWPHPFRCTRTQVGGAGHDAQSMAALAPVPARRTSRQAQPRDAHDHAWMAGNTSSKTHRPERAHGFRRAWHRWSSESNHPRVRPGQKRADDTTASGSPLKQLLQPRFLRATGSWSANLLGYSCGSRYSRRRSAPARNA
jgi:hypothetical protein